MFGCVQYLQGPNNHQFAHVSEQKQDQEKNFGLFLLSTSWFSKGAVKVIHILTKKNTELIIS